MTLVGLEALTNGRELQERTYASEGLGELDLCAIQHLGDDCALFTSEPHRAHALFDLGTVALAETLDPGLEMSKESGAVRDRVEG
jgi:hypothetical protein